MSLKHRMDVRTKEVFAHNIGDFTERETIFTEALKRDYLEKGIECEVEDRGVDGTGKKIFKKLKHNNCDKKFKFSDGTEKLLEFKTIPEGKPFMTFKVVNMKGNVEKGEEVIVCKLQEFYIFSTKAMQSMLDNHPHNYYSWFSDNDLAIQVQMTFIERLITDGLVYRGNWGRTAVEFINENKKVLTRKKRV